MLGRHKFLYPNTQLVSIQCFEMSTFLMQCSAHFEMWQSLNQLLKGLWGFVWPHIIQKLCQMIPSALRLKEGLIYMCVQGLQKVGRFVPCKFFCKETGDAHIKLWRP